MNRNFRRVPYAPLEPGVTYKNIGSPVHIPLDLVFYLQEQVKSARSVAPLLFFFPVVRGAVQVDHDLPV